MEYLLHIVVLIAIYAILTTSLDLLAGQMGVLSITHAAFYGLGAYTSSLFMAQLGAPFLIALAAGMLVAGLVSFIASLPASRLYDDYFVIATFGFQMIVFTVVNNWTELTRGALGIPGIPEPLVFGWHVDSPLEFVAVAALLTAIAYVATWRIATSPFGRVLRAIREDEIFTMALCKNPLYFKVTTFAISAALAAMAGSLYAHYITYIDPTNFTVMESILILSMVIIGGAGSVWGPLVGAVVLVTLPEVLRFVGLPSAVAANLRQVIYGILLILMLTLRPRGLVGTYAFSK